MRAWLDIEMAPRDGTELTVYDPKPSPVYGPDIHKAFWDAERNRFVAATSVSTDPYDIDPESWLCEDVDAFFGTDDESWRIT